MADMEIIGFPNNNALSVLAPKNVLLTLYSENVFRGDELEIDGATTTPKNGEQMECINLNANGRNFGDRTSSLKVMHKENYAIGRWVHLENGTTSFTSEITVGTTKSKQVDTSTTTKFAI